MPNKKYSAFGRLSKKYKSAKIVIYKKPENMRKTLSAIAIAICLFAFSCKKKCDCSKIWDSSVTYVKNDMVSYDGKCWKAVGQGKGIIPGPWLQNGNDIWEECRQKN